MTEGQICCKMGELTMDPNVLIPRIASSRKLFFNAKITLY